MTKEKQAVKENATENDFGLTADKPITNDEPIREYGRLDNDRN